MTIYRLNQLAVLMAACAQMFSVPVAVMRSRQKIEEYVWARYTFCFLAYATRAATKRMLALILRRCPDSIDHARRRVRERLTVDRRFAEAMKQTCAFARAKGVAI